MALITPLLIRVAPGHKQQEEERGSIRDEISKRLALAEHGDLEQLLRGVIEDQEKQKKKKQERRSEGPGETDAESDRLLRAAQAADRGQLRTAARLLRGSNLLPPTEATADAIEQLHQTSNDAQKRTDGEFEAPTHSFKSDVRQQHVVTHIRHAKRQAHLGPSGERNSHISALLVSPRGLPILTQWVQLWADRRLDPAFTEPWIQAKVIGGDQRRRQGQTGSL